MQRSSLGGFRLDAFSGYPCPTVYPGVARAGQLAPGLVLPNPLVLRKDPINVATTMADRDRPGSRRSEPRLAYRFNGRTAQPLGPPTAPGCDEPTSRCKPLRRYGRSGAISLLSPGYLLSDSTTLPHGIAGSLEPTFVTARPVCLAVKPACALTLETRFPTALSRPLCSSVTL